MTVIKSNIPAPRYRTLIGREEIVLRVLGLLEGDPAGRHVLVHGPAGVGKTSIVA